MSEEQQVKSAARPTGKRQLAGVSTTSTADMEAKRVSVSGSADSEKKNSIAHFFPEVGKEMRKVIWPTGRQMVNYTLITFGFLIAMTALVSGVDFLAGLGVEKIFTP
ncbi:preprotein translocase subunit SecE [Corynebacterium sp. sy039]|uniref:preprotein translocase subunit SecE n=1 Tax=Corynebacterium sp. sy039 TaxID=2599641 RepID=UPI0011B823E8|nr:preprotein translocase subunit SecE [Corynebacterium sp. sy039]QDZ43225.1 preprotein translocase subunit SecE [Corynebacterium sp. sy039]